MIPKVVAASYVDNHIIHLCFADGAEGDVDLGGELDGDVFEPLRDRHTFKKFEIHPEFHTLCWPNGADFAPEFLYEKLMIPA